MRSDRICSASTGVARIVDHHAEIGRPSTAKAEYSRPIKPAFGWHRCLVPSPQVRTSLSRHMAANLVLFRENSPKIVTRLAAFVVFKRAVRLPAAAGEQSVQGSPSRNDRKTYRCVVAPATLVRGILCSTGGTPPSAKITRYFAPFFRCCRTSRWATLSCQFRAASFVGNS